MEDDKIIVQAKIAKARTPVEKYVPSRDYASEKKVLAELREKLERQGKLKKMSDADFLSHYKERLRSYAPYVNGYYVDIAVEDGKPGILVSRQIWEHELLLEYSIDDRNYSKTVHYAAETRMLTSGSSFYITVNRQEPKKILKMSDKDYRQPEEDGCLGGMLYLAGMLILIGYIMVKFFL